MATSVLVYCTCNTPLEVFTKQIKKKISFPAASECVFEYTCVCVFTVVQRLELWKPSLSHMCVLTRALAVFVCFLHRGAAMRALGRPPPLLSSPPSLILLLSVPFCPFLSPYIPYTLSLSSLWLWLHSTGGSGDGSGRHTHRILLRVAQ